MYENRDTANDPDNNHISIQTNGEKPNSANHNYSIGLCRSFDLPTLNNGSEYKVQIIYQQGYITVLLNNQIKLETQVELSSLIKSNEAYIGFTASTGGLCQSHTITQFKFHSISINSIKLPSNINNNNENNDDE
eukprot:TRINITY_DN13905_c0_g1_i1.p1 TRINITY_DN13905_c0_g1~~TRINITY_DN13905_c0_g1_i1.p1  ORF type:complete len:134 (+),score=30.33 TRINITY_DN13905_c0_g1_i1:152-553(+)